jgi:Uma2 family endonuclease
VEDEYVSGPLDLIVEVASTTRALDLGRKKRDYEKAGIREYVVVLAKEKSIRWFLNGEDGFVEEPPSEEGVYRSKVFPGLWLTIRTLFDSDPNSLSDMLNQGLASPEHAAFVAELKARRTKHRKRKGK